MIFNESTIENHTLDLLQEVGFSYIPKDILDLEREDFTLVVLLSRFKDSVYKLNQALPKEIIDFAIKEFFRTSSLGSSVVENNRIAHKMLTHGVPVDVFEGEHMRGRSVKLVDWDNINNNDFVCTNQFYIKGLRDKIPDVVLFLNGLPIIVIELKDAKNMEATVHKAFTQLGNYQTAIPELFTYNALLIISDGLDARSGTISSDFKRFLAWKSVNGKKEESKTVPQIETLVKGMCVPEILLDLISNFTMFESEEKFDSNGLTYVSIIKKVAAYHQYFAVNRAVESTLRASATNISGVHEHPSVYGQPSSDSQERGDRRAGVVWHTQGSGKSLSMVFYSGKIVQKMNNPTIVVVTDRNDLDEQLFDTFSGAKDLLGQAPVKAESRSHLRELLKVAGGGVVFTTIQKFSLFEGEIAYDKLSERSNIVVMADEAHRTQYGFEAKVNETNGKIAYGFAKYLRDGLPNASFIGFTGTPIEKEDANTRNVFGEYVDIYDIQAAVTDGATVQISYESRLVKILLNEEQKEELDEAVESVCESEELTVSEKAKAKYAQLEAIVGNADRIKDIAEDLVTHFEARQNVFEGKAMIVAMSRRIAIELYNEIVKLKPEWHDNNLSKGALKVVMTAASSDPSEWQPYHTTKDERKNLAKRFKDPKDELKIVIVRDMWLTGFDVPCLHTMYVDKPMRGANLMQAIARVNRVFKDKPGGLIVDYIGIASDLKKALATYTENGGKGIAAADLKKDIIPQMLSKFEVVQGILVDCPKCSNYMTLFKGNTHERLTVILETEDCLLGDDKRKERFLKEVSVLSQLYALATPDPETYKIRDEVAFFQAVKARLIKLASDGGSRDVEIDTLIRQIVDGAVVSEGIIDIFDAAGIKKPDISILSDEFLEEVRTMPHQNIALEMLKRILNGEINLRVAKNFAQGKKFSEMLQGAIVRYQNNLLTSTEVIAELIDLAKTIRSEKERCVVKGLTDDEIAFYDALAINESAENIMGDDKLKELARLLVESVRVNATVDWNRRESARANMRVVVKRLLKKYGYPPDLELMAIDTVLTQAELFAGQK